MSQAPWTLEHGDCRERMAALADGTFDAIVTDPPYGLAFMGKAWDHGVPGVPFWMEALRVAKPGAHLVAFGGTRTFHRLAVAIEDAGWDVRDCLSWLYGSGFPKSHNGPWGGTALKPAWEPIILARKPLIGTVAANVTAHGTGALNIDGCRIPHDEECRLLPPSQANIDNPSEKHRQAGRRVETLELKPSGRWPANVVLDEAAAAMLDAQSGQLTSGNEGEGGHRRNGDKFRNTYSDFAGTPIERGVLYGDTGGPSRFYYCAKAGRAEREAGLEGAERRAKLWSSGTQNPGSFQAPGTDRTSTNHHPTVKPIALMRWLCRLVTPAGGLILDPFTGSGSTGCAALLEGFRFHGMELMADYLPIAEARLAYWHQMASTARSAGTQLTLDDL